MNREDMAKMYACSGCGVEKDWSEFFRAMRSGKKPLLCTACRKAASHPRPTRRRLAGARTKYRSVLTHQATPAEDRLFQALTFLWGNRVYWEFQKPIGPFFADFAVPQSRLVIEVDGGYHLDPMQVARDQRRTAYLEAHGWEVMRFTNERVFSEVGSVVMEISKKIGVRS